MVGTKGHHDVSSSELALLQNAGQEYETLAGYEKLVDQIFPEPQERPTQGSRENLTEATNTIEPQTTQHQLVPLRHDNVVDWQSQTRVILMARIKPVTLMPQTNAAGPASTTATEDTEVFGERNLQYQRSSWLNGHYH